MVSPRVIVAGAGPVGLALALGLARGGASVDVFEAEDQLSDDPRASTWHPPTLEMLAEWGVIDEVLARGTQIGSLQFWDRVNRTCVADLPYRLIAGDTPYPFRFQCPQHQVSPILLEAARAAGARVHFGQRIVGQVDRGDGVEVQVDGPGGLRTEPAAWLCGADGARSTVRTCLGLPLVGRTYEDRFLLVAGRFDVDAALPGFGEVGYVFDPDEWVIVMKLAALTRIVFRLGPDEDAEAARRDDAVRARLERLLGPGTAEAIEMTSYYAVHQRVVERFRNGRVLLLGDAAHVNNPAGGMGMNSGIHDAHGLVDALGRVLAGEPEALLDAWAEARRRIAVEAVQRDSDQTYRDLVERDPARRLERNRRFGELAIDPVAARAYLLRSAMLTHRGPEAA